MISMTNRLLRRERKRLQQKTEQAKQRGGVSASLFLEEDMNALADADCFFFYGNRFRPKGLLTVFFPDEVHAEITVAVFLPGERVLPALYECALRECRRVKAEEVYTVRDPAYGFAFGEVPGVRFSYEWSEYILGIGMGTLAEAEGIPGEAEEKITKEEAPEGDGTLRYSLWRNGNRAAECRILPVADGRQCYLFGLETKEEFRRTGAATALLKGIAKEYAGTEGSVLRLQVSSKNVPAERLYRKLGFCTEEEREYYKTEELPDGRKD